MAIEFEVVKHVTLPILKVPDDGTPVYIRVDSAIVTAKEIKGQRERKDKEGNIQTPPEIMQVTNLASGNPAQMVVNTVLSSELKDKYPDDGYVNRSFQIKKFKAAEGKRYKLFEILEIKLKGQTSSNSAPSQPAKKSAK